MCWSVIGPLEGKLTGQSRVTIEVSNILRNNKKLACQVNTNFEGLKVNARILKSIFALLYFIKTLRVSNGYYISIKRGILSSFLDFMYIIIAKIFKKNVILHLHGNEILCSSKTNMTLTFNFAILNLRLADMVLCLNSFQANELRKLGISTMKIIPNFTELNSGNNYSEDLVIDRSNLRVTYLSNFQEEKGFLKYLSLFETFPDIQFSLCGAFLSNDSKERKAFNEPYINSLPNVRYHGFVNGSAKQRVLSNSHFIFFISTYATEAQPLSLIEAMGLGCVPIVANRPYISDIVTSENGVILSSDPDMDEIRNAISSLTIEKYFKLSENCRKLAASHTTTAFEAGLLDTFDEVI